MSTQPSLFDAPRENKEKIAALRRKTRDVLHRELYKFFEANRARSDSDYEYASGIELAYARNAKLANYLYETYSPTDLAAGIILFLQQIEKNKIIYNKKARGLRTYTAKHLFQQERGEPAVFLEEILEKISREYNLSEYAPIISELLLENIGEGTGRKEKMFLNIVTMIGTKKEVKALKFYKKEVTKGNFGHPIFIVEGNDARRVDGFVKKELQTKLIKRIDSMIKNLSKKK